VLELMASTDNADTQWHRDRALGHEGLGDVLRDKHDWPAALREYQEFLGIMEKLIQQHAPDARWRRDVAAGHERVGEAFFLLGQKEKARSEFGLCLSNFDARAPFDPRNPEPRNLRERCESGMSSNGPDEAK
jgi:hypothetical protein